MSYYGQGFIREVARVLQSFHTTNRFFIPSPGHLAQFLSTGMLFGGLGCVYIFKYDQASQGVAINSIHYQVT